MTKRNQPLIVLAGGLVLIAAAVVAGIIFLTRGDDGPDVSDTVSNGGEKPSRSTGGTAGGEEKLSNGPADQWTLLLGELPENYEVDVSNTFAMNVSTFSSSYWFKSDQEGSQKALDWKILDGYQVYFQPKGLAAEVVQGQGFYLRVESYLFNDVAGAKAAYAHLDNLMKTGSGSETVKAKPLGNESAAYRVVSGTVGASEMIGVYHRFNFRRGNVVVSVQTYGGQPFMNIDPAREVAVTIDNKLLGTRPAAEPTAIPTPNFPGLGN